MDKKKRTIVHLLGFYLLSLANIGYAQQDSLSRHNFSVELQSGYINNKGVPLWMRSNQYGSIPLSGASVSVLGRAFKDYRTVEWQGKSTPNSPVVDWGYAIEGRVNAGRKFQGQLIEAHVKMRVAMFEARVGRSKDVMGLNGDTVLTSGNFSVSGNALGVPKFEISIPSYYRLPWLGGLLSFKGNFATGYMGKMDMNPSAFRVPTSDYAVETFLHQKSLYGRLGKPSWRLQLYGGFNHQAQWGGEKKRYGEDYKLNFFQTLTHVTLGQAYGGKGNPIPRSKVGNHQGSIDLGASYNFGPVSLMLYRQSFYDVGAISKLANIADGLNGITMKNNRYQPKSPKNWDWEKLLFEFFYSKDQAGYPWSKPTSSGDEDYYNNSEYMEGWSYLGTGMGSPLIPTAASVRPGQAHYPKDYFISNRVVAGHIGASGRLYQWHVLTKITLARHFGTFATSEFGKSTGSHFHRPYVDRFEPVHQFSFFLRTERAIDQKTSVGGSFATDQGKLLYSGSGVLIHLRRTF
ncbi:capsule assembly Wzi family protein [Sphingobacterium suaedae]|uniref:Capsule assembly Wzi family protein n=1 Tax=Sphingobacterium suaedae TaxID=1686402 RepID=A0ABW5KMG0_9SPHI